MVDIDAIEDPVEKKSIESQILNFGQCPAMLFFVSEFAPYILTIFARNLTQRDGLQRKLHVDPRMLLKEQLRAFTLHFLPFMITWILRYLR